MLYLSGHGYCGTPTAVDIGKLGKGLTVEQGYQAARNAGVCVLANGGSCIAGPDGEWIIESVIGKEGLIIGHLDLNKVLEERQNFDVSGYYSRPDVTKLTVNRERQSILDIKED